MDLSDQHEGKRVIVLASGGLDSTACIAYYLNLGYEVKPLWMNYGQKAARMENFAIRRVTRSQSYHCRLSC
ncbi:MAG: 7-cyano-7-deazaguanine synthase [Chloroflexi bacterium]|nr:7-cyano-7-deazaguanine synthase [Chloroflexota bacterium]